MPAHSHSFLIFRRLLLPLFAAAFLGYFAFHAFHGTYGIWAKADFEAQAVRLEADLAALQAERRDLMRHVSLLRSETLDPDMVDEMARTQLNVIGPNEVVILP